jgi:hypothetical protein
MGRDFCNNPPKFYGQNAQEGARGMAVLEGGIIEELDKILEKLTEALNQTGFKGGISFKSLSVSESTKEGTGYIAHYGLGIELPHSLKHYGAAFGKKATEGGKEIGKFLETD